MIIQITDSVRFRYEDKNYMLERLRVVQEGKNAGMEVWDVVAYHSSFKDVAQSLLDRHFYLIAGKDGAIGVVKDLKSLIDAVDYGADLIARACADAKRDR